MSTRTTTIIVLIMILGATFAGLLLWNRLPELMASHWGPNDQVDGYMTKFWGVFLMPLISLSFLALTRSRQISLNSATCSTCSSR